MGRGGVDLANNNSNGTLIDTWETKDWISPAEAMESGRK